MLMLRRADMPLCHYFSPDFAAAERAAACSSFRHVVFFFFVTLRHATRLFQEAAAMMLTGDC